jgi:hypothetical protein
VPGGINLVLTDQEKQMLSGDLGPGIAKAMEIQVAIGEAFGADRMVEISRAHEAFYASESCAWFLELFAGLNAHCRVPTTCNPIFDESYFDRMGKPIPKEDLIYARRTREARKKIGIIPNECCTPYLQDNVPTKGEIIAFSESNATCYANSICGARSHRESANSALAAAVTGRVPWYGLMLKENRIGNILIKIEANLKDDFDYHLLGYTLGKEVGADIPIFTELALCPPSAEELISLGAELATSGTISMYHIAGLTPEAPDVEAALNGKPPKKTMTVTESMLEKTQTAMSYEGGKIDFVMLGCPHYTLNQIRDAARLLEGKKIKKDIDFWILTSAATKRCAEHVGYLQIINKAGGHIISATCSDQICWEHLYRGKVGLTDSPKAVYYNFPRGIHFVLRRRSKCIQAALEGGL